MWLHAYCVLLCCSRAKNDFLFSASTVSFVPHDVMNQDRLVRACQNSLLSPATGFSTGIKVLTSRKLPLPRALSLDYVGATHCNDPNVYGQKALQQSLELVCIILAIKMTGNIIPISCNNPPLTSCRRVATVEQLRCLLLDAIHNHTISGGS